MQREATALRLLERGVWDADYLIEGFPALHAIDSNGNCIRRVKLQPEIDYGVARAWLEGYLEHFDPRPQLKLVKSLPAAATMSHGAVVRLFQYRR